MSFRSWGTLRSKGSGLCVSLVRVEELAHVPRGMGPRSWRGAVCVYVGLEAVLAASVLCVTLPSRGQVPSDPREPQPKLQRGWGRQQSGPRGSKHGGLLVSCRVLPRELEGHCHFLSHPLPLQAASLLPQCLMPGHTATEYAICVGDIPTPTRAAPKSPGCGCPGPPQQPLPICLHTENGA